MDITYKQAKKAARREASAIRKESREIFKRDIDALKEDDTKAQLSFPSTLSKAERKQLHRYATRIGLKSKSTGSGESRFLTIFKKVCAVDFFEGINAQLILSVDSIETIDKLLSRDPLTNEEKSANVLTTTEKEVNSRLPFNFTIGNERKKKLFTIPPVAKESKPIKSTRENLPIFVHRAEILDAINKNPVVVISGETGSGKTTQVPQYIMEECMEKDKVCRIICTQPRRLAATSIADRVSFERGDRIGNSVGYQIRMDSRISADTNLIFTTSGYLLRCLMGSKSGEIFHSVTHLLLDEVHEREKITDFLLIAIKEGLAINPNLKIVLMSATIDSEIFSKYFFDCPVINVPGRTFDVSVIYLGEILMMTKYKTKRMQEYMTQNKGPKILRREPVGIEEVNKVKGDADATANSGEQEKNLPKETTSDENASKVHVPEEDIEFFDECLEGCLFSDHDTSFDQIYYLITDENMPIDYLHSKLSRSALTIAAERGYFHVITTLLGFGANAALCGVDSISALNYAKRNNHADCVQLLEQYENATDETTTTNVGSLPAIDQLSDEYEKAHEQFCLAAYQLTSCRQNEIDHDLLFSIIKNVHETQTMDGSILVFLPGYDDIMKQKDFIESFLLTKNFQLFVLHSGVNGTKSNDEKRVFQRATQGYRKIILSTNIAETSLTIDDVVHVIDSGKVKQQTYDSISDTTCLTSTWISQACAKQRAGRAGRTRNGHCYRMYSLEHYETMEKYTLPEILRVPLTDICLNAKILADQISIEEFLLKALQPPPVLSIRQSINLLKKIDALDADENITHLGIHLADLPVDAQLGKCIMYAILFKCIDPVVTIVSALSVKDPFMLPLGDDGPRIQMIKKVFADDTLSDHMMLLKTFDDWFHKRLSSSEKKFAHENMISNGNMEMIRGVRKLIIGHLRMVGIIDENSARSTKQLNANSKNWSIVKACLTAGFYPNVCRINLRNGKIYSKYDKKLLPHLSSVLRERKSGNQLDPNVMESGTEWLIHGEKSRVSHYSLIRNISAVPAINIALFAGPLSLPESNVWTLQIDQWNTNDEQMFNGGCNADLEDDDDNDDDDDDDDDDGDDDDVGYGISGGYQNQDATFMLDDWISFSMEKHEADIIYRLRQKVNAILVKLLKNPSSFTLSNRDARALVVAEQVLVFEDHLKKHDEKLSAANRKLVQNMSDTNFKRNQFDIFDDSGTVFMSSAYSSAIQPENRRQNRNLKSSGNKKKRNRKGKEKKAKQNFDVALPHYFDPYQATTSQAHASDYRNNPNINQLNGRPAMHDMQLGGSAQTDLIHGLFNDSYPSNNYQFNGGPSNQTFTKYFVVTIQTVDTLIESVYRKRWLFNKPISELRQIEQEYPSAVIILFFYVQEKSAIFGAGTFSSTNNNSSYQIICQTTHTGYSLKPVKYFPIQDDYEMDPNTGYDLLEWCKRA